MSAEYLIFLPDGTTEGPYTEEDLLDMVDADELAAGTICQDTQSGRKCRVFDLFRIIRAEALAAEEKSAAELKDAGDNSDGIDEDEDDEENDDDDEGDEPMDAGHGPQASRAPARSGPGNPKTNSKNPPPGRPAGNPEIAGAKSGKWIPAPLKEVTEGEIVLPLRTIFTGHPSFLMYWKSLLLSVLLMAGGWYAGRWEEGGWWLAGGWMTGGVLLALTLLRRSSVEYRVTTRRVEVERGFFSKSSFEIRIPDIRSINVRKTGASGFLGVGDLIFSSSGGGEEDVVFRQVSGAHRIKNRVRRLQDRGS
ncbi:MAG: hypothetical protein JWL81_421 [Verrucomicrobiales bacterium]|nr:hypothetical protein [Verrucomicrobiales bacterium]